MGVSRETERLRQAADTQGYEVVTVIAEQTCGWMGARLEVLDPAKQLQPTEELAQDLLTTVTVFAGRPYGSTLARGIRSRVQMALKGCEETAQATTEEPHGTG
jgi:predicted site-specific integrase-resolvase